MSGALIKKEAPRPDNHDVETLPGAPEDPAPLGRGVAEAVVLVVDDHRPNVALLERLLDRMGVARVVGITDSRLAVAQYQAVQPDLILLDLHMPHLDGLAVLDALAQAIPADSFVPVLVLTADATDGAKRAALAAGAKDFLTKPFDHGEVVLRVKNLLETRAMHVALQRHNTDLRAELAEHAEHERRLAEEHEELVGRVRQVLDHSSITMVFQPIVDLLSGAVAGYEALARFPGSLPRGPDEWFRDAVMAGLGSDLELLAIRSAVADIDSVPDDAYLSLNVSPATALLPQLAEILAVVGDRVLLELTEHTPVDEYQRLVGALTQLRRLGVRVAVDDAGSGYASLRHILRLDPAVIKLDLDLTRGIDTDPARRALAASLVVFGQEIGATIVAEGIETATELDALRRLGVRFGQGYHLGRPAPLPTGRRSVASVVTAR